ncbi:class I SAM-dependent methyltransferase [Streptomyces sp. NPDC057217]|uniref:class I SAM-dependent methyltransferase n=1 Tax=Streptomyces sp. NPDC057217 TaxID=3346054 RepID=UPI003643F4CA
MIDQASPWHAYAEQVPHVPGPSPVRQRMEWGMHPGIGPDARVLGPALHERRVLELGCGNGHNAAHLAGVHGAEVTAVDLVGTQIRRANEKYGALKGLTFLICDALRFLRNGTLPFDSVYSVFGALGLTDPEIMLPAVARRLRTHGRLVFSVPHPRRRNRSSPPDGRPHLDFLLLPDGTRRPVTRWEPDVPGWHSALHRAGFRPTGVHELPDPRRARLTTLVISARRR